MTESDGEVVRRDYSLLRNRPSLNVKTVADVTAWIEYIKKIAWDDEGAHGSEDDMHKAVLKSIATGKAKDPRAMARKALKTSEIEFCRWCA